MTPPTSKIQSQNHAAALKDNAASTIVAPETDGKAEQSGQRSIEPQQASKADQQQAKQQRGSKFQALKARFSKSKTAKAKAFKSPSAAGPNSEPEKAKALTRQTRPKKAEKPQTKPDAATPATSLNAHELVLGWFKAYPGLWLSPLALGLLGGWVIAQPDPNPSETAPETAALETGTPLPPFIYREAAPLGPFSPYGETEIASPDDEVLADPPDATDLAKAELDAQKAALEKLASEKVAQANNTDISAALPGVPSAGAQAAETSQANQAAIANQIEDQIEAQASSAAQAQVAADAKFALEERAKAQAAAFAQAQANQAASDTPPQPAPPVQGNPAVDQLITMQVAIAEGDTTLSMGGSNQSVIMTQAGEPLLQLEAGEYGMQCDGSGLLLNGQQLPATVMMAPYGGGLNYVRDRSYRGQIQFICQGNTVLAVNHIDMLQYLYSVVGSEVSASWPEAALKAQSVAARSYALTYYFRPAKEHFHIGDTESYQVYKGTVSEDERVKAAVQATAGEFISYQGGIVESLYAASDDIVMEAFQGGGMSQLGALDFAEQGYNYLQILGYYYPQTSLGRMVIEDGA